MIQLNKIALVSTAAMFLSVGAHAESPTEGSCSTRANESYTQAITVLSKTAAIQGLPQRLKQDVGSTLAYVIDSQQKDCEHGQSDLRLPVSTRITGVASEMNDLVESYSLPANAFVSDVTAQAAYLALIANALQFE